MKNCVNALAVVATGVTLVGVFNSNPVQAMTLTFNFSQSGWLPDGGEVTGQFVAEDINADMVISTSEVSSYLMNFTGNGTISAFSHTLADLQLLDYTLGSSTVNQLFSINGSGSYDASSGTISAGGDTINTAQPVNVVAVSVPEPSAIAGLIVVGLGGYLTRKRQKS